MAFVVKGIKPKKLKTDAIRLEILNALRAEGRDHVKEYKKTVSTWRNNVDFDYIISLTYEDASVLSGPSGGPGLEAWNRLNETGINPPRRDIVPVRAKALRFRSGYRRKSVARKFTSRPGGAYGDVVYTKRVRASARKKVPPTEWTKTLAKQRKRPYRQRILKAVRRGAEKMF